MLSLELQSDIRYRTHTYTRFKSATDSNSIYCSIPIYSVYNNLNGKPLLVISEGGQGKSSCMEILQAKLLIKNIPCFVFKCADLVPIVLTEIASSSFAKNSIIIFDGWDEIQKSKLRKEITSSVKSLLEHYQIIVTSRYNPNIDHICDDEKSLFGNFDVAEICTFNTEQIKEIIGEKTGFSSRFLELLSNTMLLSIYLDSNESERSVLCTSENAAMFMRKYFMQLPNRKGERVGNIDKIFRDAGELLYFNLRNKKVPFERNINYFSSFNHIVWEIEQDGGWKLKYNHFRYAMFCLAMYLKDEILRYYQNLPGEIPEALNYSYFANYKDALILAGELLDKNEVNAILESVNYQIEDNFAGNVLYVLLGSNNLCFNDVYFRMRDDDYKYLNKNSFFCANKYIRKIELQYLSLCIISSPDANKYTMGFLGSENLQEIFVDQNHPTLCEENNCIINRKKTHLILGCSNSIIPNTVKVIMPKAFYRNRLIKSICIPDNVKTIGEKAFAGCTNLRELIIPDSVEKVSASVIRGNTRLRKLIIGKRVREINNNTFAISEATCMRFSSQAENNIEQLSVSDENPRYCSINNCLVDKDTSTLILGSKKCTIIPQIKTIGEWSFASTECDEFKIPFGVQTIECGAFAGAKIKRCILPQTVTKIDKWAFSNCRKLVFLEIPMNAHINWLALKHLAPYRTIVKRHVKNITDATVIYEFGVKLGAGHTFVLEDDGSITPPEYFTELKKSAKELFENLIQKALENLNEVSLSNVIALLKNQLAETAEKIFDDMFEGSASSGYNTNEQIYLLEVLNDSKSIEEVWQHFY